MYASNSGESASERFHASFEYFFLHPESTNIPNATDVQSDKVLVISKRILRNCSFLDCVSFLKDRNIRCRPLPLPDGPPGFREGGIQQPPPDRSVLPPDCGRSPCRYKGMCKDTKKSGGLHTISRNERRRFREVLFRLRIGGTAVGKGRREPKRIASAESRYRPFSCPGCRSAAPGAVRGVRSPVSTGFQFRCPSFLIIFAW